MSEKIKNVTFNNRKKSFEVETSKRRTLLFPYSRCETQPATGNFVTEAYPDPELGKLGFSYCLQDGSEESILLDQVLDYNHDPEYVKNMRLYRMTVKALQLFKTSGISKTEICRHLGWPRATLDRLLDPECYTKSTDKMIDLFEALSCPLEIICDGEKIA